MATHTLGVQDRLNLLQILPERGNYLTLKVIDALRQQLALSDEEIEQFEVRQGGELDHSSPPKLVPEGVVVWNRKNETPKEVEISRPAHREIERALQKLDEQEQLTAAMLPLYEVFMKDEEVEEGGSVAPIRSQRKART